jgi:hypothetical protein
VRYIQNLRSICKQCIYPFHLSTTNRQRIQRKLPGSDSSELSLTHFVKWYVYSDNKTSDW